MAEEQELPQFKRIKTENASIKHYEIGDISKISGSNTIDYETEVFDDRKQNIIKQLYGHWLAQNDISQLTINFDITIKADVLLPNISLSLSKTVSNTFPRTVRRNEAPTNPLTIVNAGVINKDKFNIEEVNNLLSGSSFVNNRKFPSEIQGKELFSLELAQQIADSLLCNLVRCDLSDIFLSLFIMEDKLRVMRLLHPGVVLKTKSAPYNGITVATTLPTNSQLDDTAGIWIAAINDCRIMLKDENLTQTDKIILRALTVGPQYWVIPNDENVIPISNSIEGQGKPLFFIYGNRIPVLPAPAAVTPEQIQATAATLARLLFCADDYVKGWVRAQCYLNGKMMQHGPGTNQRLIYMTSTFETTRVKSPHPKGCNGLWNILKLEKPPVNLDLHWLEEYNCLKQMSTTERALVGALLAAVISVNVSSTLNYFNISGRELNSWVSTPEERRNSAKALLDSLMISGGDGRVILFRMMAGSIPKTSRMVLNDSCFDGADWCSGNLEIPGLNANSYWQGQWPRKIPYIVNPFSISWSLTKWYSLWGYISPYVTFIFDRDLLIHQTPYMDYLCLGRGDSSYQITAGSDRPYKYISYGILAYNIIRSHIRTNQHHRFTYRMIHRFPNEIYEATKMIDLDEMQPDYNDATFTIMPGSILSYDYEKQCVLVPYISGHELSTIFSEGANEATSSYAGWILNGVPDTQLVTPAPTAFLKYIKGKIYTTRAPVITPRHFPEN